MVPSLRPLETLHNKLTMRDMDLFFGRVTTTKFTAVSSPPYGSSSTTPVVSPRPPTFIKGTGISLPSSSNSSAGPSSPTSGSTPVDLVSQLRLYIKEIDSGQSEMLTGQSETDSSQSNELTENKTDNFGKTCPVVADTDVAKSCEYTGNRFKVSQTENGTLPVKSEKSDQAEVAVSKTNCQPDRISSDTQKSGIGSDTKSKQINMEQEVTSHEERSNTECSGGTDYDENYKEIEKTKKSKNDKFVIDTVSDEQHHCCK
ncbi:inositol hexakisphosphate and diphosphoinositol-pentakisphosphate kinase 1-like [Pecten maximus]|uniref:inositol hexakisphosphate and diphosphoinositol-pentakisphosphate kinase 1-like n=1 Tax=Pecten maximus TaxID=6579 RepID=UPI00145811BE|nr:inositol hexakisphosphate and diphosphoinositol-pentakisphosphate kinase 1-like [Pecten maximus]